MQFFPWVWFTEVFLTATNANLNGTPISIGELLRYIGLWLRMSSVGGGFKRDDLWSTASFDKDNNPCPYNFQKYMSKARFDAITAALTFTDKAAPTCTD